MAGAQGVIITTDVPVEGRYAVPCYVDESLPIVGPSRAVQVFTSGPMAGGPPMPIRLAPEGTPAIGPALPIYIVSGILDVLAYTSKVKAVAPGNLIAYWPLAESSGTAIQDESGNAYNGTYTAVTLGQTGIGDGRTSALFDGSTSRGNVYSAGFAGAFNNQEGTFAIWFRVAAVGVWTDGINRRLVRLAVDANNQVYINKSASNNALDLIYQAGGTAKGVSPATFAGNIGWNHLALTWSKSGDAVKAYVNGAQSGATATGLGVWAGALAATTTVLGAFVTTPSNVFSGMLAHPAVWSTPLSAAQIAQIATVP
jgi:hypothetical protein